MIADKEEMNTPSEMFALSVALEAGRLAFNGGFSPQANTYRDNPRRWAWDLGWREQEFEAMRAREIADEERKRLDALRASDRSKRSSVFGGLR